MLLNKVLPKGEADGRGRSRSVEKTEDDDISSVVEPAEEKTKHFDKNSLLIYTSHFLSSFGDRIWQFAVGLYLYYLYPCSLLLTAVYGFSTCISLFLLGAPLGRWVDKSKRLRAARITIVVQNACVVIGAAIMASAIFYKDEVKTWWKGKLEILVYAIIIIVEIIAELASMANKLVLEKDWIVVLARGNPQKLSTLNATMRTISLTCKILAPFVVGHLFEFFSYLTAAICIAVWNVLSALCEYYLLYVIFSLVPELARKSETSATIVPSGNMTSAPQTQKKSSQDDKLANNDLGGSNLIGKVGSGKIPENMDAAGMTQATNPDQEIDGESMNNNHKQMLDHVISEIEKPKNDDENDGINVPEEDGQGDNSLEKKSKSCQCCAGWSTYFSHNVKFAGLGLASLYMTVLSFDNVTIGFLASQGVSSAVVGNLTAVSALIGILGSLSFPFFRKRFGKKVAGLIGFGLETACLLFCVVSIIAPGSPFEPSSIQKILDHPTSCRNKTGQPSLSVKELWDSHINIYFLLAGVVSARYGLWIADLSVTQIFQEKVHQSKRGVMGGVQGSLNQLMSLLKFSLTIVLPYPESFGYLICLSWSFVFLGGVLFLVFVCTDRRRKNKIDL